MDIVMTLAKDLWPKIISGEKAVEMRKWPLPLHFNLELDCIYVVVKGTRRIAGSFKVVNVFLRNNKDEAWAEFGEKLGVSYEWFSKYWDNNQFRYMYFYAIGDCHVAAPHFKIEVPCAPQKYVNVTERIKSTSYGFHILKHKIL